MQIWLPSSTVHLTRLRIIWLGILCLFATFGLTSLLLNRYNLVLRHNPALYKKIDNAEANEEVLLEPVIIVASQQGDETTWLDEFEHWPKATYVTDDSSAHYTVPKNKGREGMVYLT